MKVRRAPRWAASFRSQQWAHHQKPPGVSILKPVKGLEPDLEENLQSFFDLHYPDFELLFSVADANDPSLPIIQKLVETHPDVKARIFVGDVTVGPNPKVNNLMQGYRDAQFDLILISDSNVRARPDYLYFVTDGFTSDVGIVTAIVSGRHPIGAGAWLETVFLNTFYARWMMIAQKFGNPVVIGKSMLFRKSDANRFGGIQALGIFLAEDYMAGQAMKYLGKKVKTMRIPVVQPIGQYSMRSFWSRHLRWGRIRKAQAPLAFFCEPLLSFCLSGLLGAWAIHSAFNWSPTLFVLMHSFVWISCDLVMMKTVGGQVSLRSGLAWGVREALHLPLWFHISIGQKVNWRGRQLTIERGGILRASND